MSDARKHSRISIVLLAVFLSLLSFLAAAQEKKEFSYTVGPGAVIFLTNNYGPISVKPSGTSQVVVETVSHSDAVNVVNEQHGDRIELRSTSSRPGTNLGVHHPTELFAHRDCVAMWSLKPRRVRWK